MVGNSGTLAFSPPRLKSPRIYPFRGKRKRKCWEKFCNTNDSLKRVLGFLVNLHMSKGILTRIARAVLVKINRWNVSIYKDPNGLLQSVVHVANSFSVYYSPSFPIWNNSTAIISTWRTPPPLLPLRPPSISSRIPETPRDYATEGFKGFNFFPALPQFHLSA